MNVICLLYNYLFLPRIQRNLDLFKEGHSRGPLSTEHNCSPEQLWIMGMLPVANSDLRTAHEFADKVQLLSGSD